MTYTPEVVQRGMKDMISFETGRPPEVCEVAGRELHVVLRKNAVTDPAGYEEELSLVLPVSYSLRMEWV